MRGALGEAAKLLRCANCGRDATPARPPARRRRAHRRRRPPARRRLADSQIRQAVELVHPGPVAGLYSPEERAAAARRIGRALDAWWARHGRRQGARAAPPSPPPLA
jgi:hypothetical protein